MNQEIFVNDTINYDALCHPPAFFWPSFMWLSGLAIARMLLKRLVCFEKEEGCFSKDMKSGSDCFCEEHLKEVRHLWLEKKKSLNVESFII